MDMETFRAVMGVGYVGVMLGVAYVALAAQDQLADALQFHKDGTSALTLFVASSVILFVGPAAALIFVPGRRPPVPVAAVAITGIIGILAGIPVVVLGEAFSPPWSDSLALALSGVGVALPLLVLVIGTGVGLALTLTKRRPFTVILLLVVAASLMGIAEILLLA
jgi:hypothetical protein